MIGWETELPVSCILSIYFCLLSLQSPVVTIRTTRFNIHKVYVLPTQLYLCVLCGSQNKKRLFPYTALTGWFLWLRRVCLLRGMDWIFIYNLRSTPHSVFMCFVWISEQTVIISLYNVNWLVFITEVECVYCVVRTGYLYIILRSAHTSCLCVLCGSQNKQRLFPYTALTDWFL